MSSHSEETPHTCLTCGKSYKYKHGLIDHQRVHTSGHSNACPLCQMTFDNSDSLSHHMKTHESQIVSAFHVNEADCGSDNSSMCNLTATKDQRTEDTGAPTSTSASNESDLSGPHFSEAPYVINVKIEESS